MTQNIGRTPEWREQAGTVGASPAKPRDEAAIRHEVYSAATEADDLLRRLLSDSNVLLGELRGEVRRVRGLLAEWRLETD